MTLDIRANVICNIGPVISGGFSDDHVQGTGLIRTRGELVLQGLHTCRPGDPVQLAYERNGQLTRIPRALRVLSSFADPFRRQTTVSIGCKLTMLENLRENKKATPPEDPENADLSCEEYGKWPINITFNFIASKCLEALGITPAAPLALVGSVAIGTFDFSQGYVSLLSDILYSQSRVGYLDAAEQLRIADLSALAETGPVLDEDDVIDVSPIRSGDMPADTVIVNYNYNRFKEPDPEQSKEEQQKRNWELVISQGAPETIEIPYNDNEGLYTVTHAPLTIVRSEYDSLDRLIKETKTELHHVAKLNSSYIKELLENDIPVELNVVEHRTEKELLYLYNDQFLVQRPEDLPPCTYWYTAIANSEYDEERDSKSIGDIEIRYESTMAMAGAIGYQQYAFDDGSFFHPGIQEVPVSIVENTYERNDEAGLNRTITKMQQSHAYAVQGQQATATIAEDIETAGDALALMFSGARLVDAGVEVNNRYDRFFGVQRRPGTQERNKVAQYKDPRTSESRFVFIQGNAGVGITTTYNLPWAPDDRIKVMGSGAYQVEASEAEVLANRFGRVQQRLTYGHRMGFACQLLPTKLPPYAAETVTMHLGGIMAQYLVNGQSWSFSSDGIIANADLLYLGGVGATNEEYRVPSPWSPVADGITQLPLAPSITTNASPAPANTIPTPEDFDPSNPGDVFDTLPTNTAPIYEKQTTVPQIIPGYREELLYSLPVKVELGVERTFISVPQERTVVTPLRSRSTVTRQLIEARITAGVVRLEMDVEAESSIRTTTPTMRLTSDVTATITYPIIWHLDGTNGSTSIASAAPASILATVAGNAQLSTTQQKFGTTSLSLDGTGDFIHYQLPTAIGTGDFTIEMWVRPATDGADFLGITGFGNFGNQAIVVDCDPSTGEVTLFDYSGNGVTHQTPLNFNVWNHLAIYRIAGTAYIAINGEVCDTPETVSVNLTNPSHTIGAYDPSGSYPFKGFIDEVRVTLGRALYGTANFTPPTAAFPNP